MMPWQLNDFQRVAHASAVIAIGSQVHDCSKWNMIKGFHPSGLGNLFFDQTGNPGMTPQIAQRYEFLWKYYSEYVV